MTNQVMRCGKTSAQMQAARTGAVYVWPTSELAYPIKLAKSLGREDLLIISLNDLRNMRLRGTYFPEIVVDHETYLDEKAKSEYLDALARYSNQPKP